MSAVAAEVPGEGKREQAESATEGSAVQAGQALPGLQVAQAPVGPTSSELAAARLPVVAVEPLPGLPALPQQPPAGSPQGSESAKRQWVRERPSRSKP